MEKEFKQEIPQFGTKEFNDLCSTFFGGKPKQETLEEAAERFSKSFSNIDILQEAFHQWFTLGIDWQQEQDKKMYSEEEVLQILFRFTNRFDLKKNIEITAEMQKEWFEQFKH